jgi:hypothetical protein
MNILKSFVSGLLAPVRFLTSRLARLVSVPRRFLGLSLPARITLVIATVLLVTLLIAMVWQIRAEGMDLQSRKLILYTSIVLGLVVLISTIVYWAVRLWLEGGLPRYPDIDDAWKAGVAALAKNRLSFQDLPVFLIIGSPDTDTARHIMRAANLQGPLDGVPEGRSPLLWYASDRAIYLVTSELGCLGHLHHSARDAQRGSAPSQPDVAEGSQARLRGTLVPGGRTGEVREAAREKTAAPSSGFPADIRGTIKPGASARRGEPHGGVVNTPRGPGLPSADVQEQTDRLTHVCQLLRRQRNPVCPINGIMTVLPYAVLADIMVAKAAPKMVRQDLDTIRSQTRVNCLTAALITGLEQETGFFELVRRLGPENAKDNRAGHRFDPEIRPTQENMETLSRQACGWFEEWVYYLFRQPDGLAQAPANRRLYQLLAKVRRDLLPRLESVLTSAFSSEEDSADTPPMMFGTYFAATGTGPSGGELYAFVRGVLNRFDEEFNAVPSRPAPDYRMEWTRAAIDEDRHYTIWTRSLYVVNGLLFAAVVLAAVAWIARRF